MRFERSFRGRRTSWLATIALLTAAALGTAACGAGSESSGDTAKASKTLEVFIPSSSVAYWKAWQEGFKDETDSLGYEVNFHENNFDAAQQNAQIKQAIGSGEKPAAWVLSPVDAGAMSASILSLQQTGIPSFAANQFPNEDQLEYFTAYVGVSDTDIGTTAGELGEKALEALKASGKQLHSPGGNAVIVTAAKTFPATYLRNDAFIKYAKEHNIDVIDIAYNTMDVASAQKAMAGLIAAHSGEGIDLVFGGADQLASGAALALRAAGYEPGKDVMLVGGNCFADTTDLENGTIFGTNLQGATTEGSFAANRVIAYLKNPKVEDGIYRAPADPDAMPEMPDTISKINYMPSPPTLGADIGTTKLWGSTFKELCSY